MKARVGGGGSAVAVVVALVLALGLAGCSEDPEPRLPPPPSTSPSAATSSAAAEPEAWEEKTPEGAIAFVEHWLDEFNTATATGETAGMENLSVDSCSSCASLAQFITDIYEAGGSISGGEWRFRDASYSSPNNGKTAGVRGLMRIPKQTVARPESVPETTGAMSAPYLFTLSWRKSAWRIDAIETQA